MALNQQQLSTVFTKLSPILGEEVAEAVAHEFARRSADDLVTKDFLRAEMAEQFRAQTKWLVGLMLTWGAFLVAVASALG